MLMILLVTFGVGKAAALVTVGIGLIGAVITGGRVIEGSGYGDPLLNAGAPVSGTDNVQTLLFTGTPTGGTFRLSVMGQTTPNIAMDTTAATLAANIVAGLETIVGTGNVAVSSSVTVPTVTFQSGAGKRPVSKIAVAAQAFTGGSSPFLSVKQIITLSGSPTSFILTVNGQSTAAITWSATDATLAANIDTALEALSGVGTGNTTVTSASSGTVVTVQFTGAPAGVIEYGLMTVGTFVGGTSPTGVVDTLTPGVLATGFGAPPGGKLIDITNKIDYINTGTALAPVFTKTGTQT